MTDELTRVLFEKISTYITNPEQIKRIDDAYELAKKSHAGQFRRSGEPYIIHPVKIAEILADYKTGPDSIISGLLHDVVEDTDTTLEEIEEKFGHTVAVIVDGVTKIGQYKFKSKAEAIAETHQKLLVASAEDIRVLVVKLADRLHNMRTIEYVLDNKRNRICLETLKVYAPIAHRLGMYRLKAELEDISFKYLEPKHYHEVSLKIQETKDARNENLSKVINEVENVLDSKNIHYEIKGRIKNIYSIYKKMQQKNKTFDEIYDLLALRIIVDDVADCYAALGQVHSIFKPLPNRFKDYIAIPKVNMYQSLHSTVITKEGIFEIQIRTLEMDNVAENGIAAHWAYKEGRKLSQEQQEIRKRLGWYNKLTELAQTKDFDGIKTEEFLGNVFEDLTSNVFIFTPVGDVFMLPQGSTPIDFAYRIHSEVGNRCVGAVVNNKMVPLDYVLHSNDIVEIHTSKSSKGPNKDWLMIVKTANARSKIKSYINVIERDELIAEGKKKFGDIVDEVGKFDDFSDELVEKKFDLKEISTKEDMFFNIGKSNISPRSAYNKLAGRKVLSEEEILESISSKQKPSNSSNPNNAYGIIVEGLDNPKIKLSNCCKPIPGDTIIGYVSKGLGFAVHRDNCPNLKNVDKNRLLHVYWSDNDNAQRRYPVNLKVLSFGSNGLVSDVVSIMATNNGQITKFDNIRRDADTFEMKLAIEVYNKTILEKIVANIEKLKDVISVERVFN